MKSNLGKRKLDSMISTFETSLGYKKKARRALKTKKRISALLASEEVKYLDVGITVSSLTTTPQIFALNDVAQGDTAFTRDGNACHSKYLQYIFGCNATILNGGPAMCKVALILDRQPNGVAPIYSQIYDTAVGPLWSNMKNIATNQDRFVILREYDILATSYQGSDGSESVLKGYIDLSKRNIRDQITRWGSTVAASPNTNGYYLAIVSNSAVVNYVQFQGTFRYAFNDN